MFGSLAASYQWLIVSGCTQGAKVQQMALLALLCLLPAVQAMILPGAGQQQQQQQQQQQHRPQHPAFRDTWIIRINAKSAVEALHGAQTMSAHGGSSSSSSSGRFSASSPSVDSYVAKIKRQVEATVAASLGSSGKIIQHYGVVLAGAAVGPLSKLEVAMLRKNPNIVSVEPSQVVKAQTTSTPHFLELDAPGGAWAQLGGMDAAGEDVVIAVLDVGIWPDLAAFSDRKDLSVSNGEYAYGPPPTHFKGTCQPAVDPPGDLPCNRKVVGCRFYLAGQGGVEEIRGKFPNDTIGCRSPSDLHASHTASTAAGNAGTSCNSDLLTTTMTGVAPRARIAIYKVLWGGGGADSDIIAALEDVVRDGADIINYSVSSSSFFNALAGPLDVAFKNTVAAGVFLAASGGNDGLFGAGSVANIGPWAFTVAASTHDRVDSDQRDVQLGDGQVFTGLGLSTSTVGPAPLVLANDVGLAGANQTAVQLCFGGFLDTARAQGKIIVCDRGELETTAKSQEVHRAGGIGMVLLDGYETQQWPVAGARWVPTVSLDLTAYDAVRAYAALPGAAATLPGIASLNFSNTAPVVARFSARGPPEIPMYDYKLVDLIKPDITAPGVNIWASVPSASFDSPPDATCLMTSGTSMSSPHIVGIAALIKSKHPSWSPAAIKSAMMTTAYNTVKTGDGAGVAAIGTPSDVGAGHVNATAALNPGIVFDSGGADWDRWLCGNKALPNGTSPDEFCADCSMDSLLCDPANLNLPSIAFYALLGPKTVLRTVTSVDPGPITWSVTPDQGSPEGYSIKVVPQSFTLEAGARRQLSITISAVKPSFKDIQYGSITWSSSDGRSARIPVAVRSLYFDVPDELKISDRPASYSYQFGTGWTGLFTTFPIGLDPPKVYTGTVVQSPSGGSLFDKDNSTVEGSAVAIKLQINGGTQWRHTRIAMFNSDLPDNNAANTDLDLWLYQGESMVGFSLKSNSSNEQIDMRNYDMGSYTLYVYAYNMTLPSLDFKVYVWNLYLPAPASSRMQSKPHSGRPASVVAGQHVPVSLAFNQRRLSNDTKYLGAVLYGRDDLSQGFKNVDFRATTLVYLV